MRLIDADELLDFVKNRYRDIVAGPYPYNFVAHDLVQIIKEQPTVDAVEVVHGEWLSAYEYALKIGVTDEERLEEAKRDMWWKFCNNCEQQVKGVRNYCSNCGAKMDGKVE
jgi:hypothetical protein